MESSVQETKLRSEIQYLTRLIAAHKAIKALQNTESVSGTKTTEKHELKALKSCHKTVAAPSWTYPGSISSHLPLPTTQKTLPSPPVPSPSLPSPFLSSLPPLSSSPLKQNVSSSSIIQNDTGHSSLDDSVQSMDVSLIEGVSPIQLRTRKEEKLVVGSKRKIGSRGQQERVTNDFKHKKMRIVISNSSCQSPNSKYVWKTNKNKDLTQSKTHLIHNISPLLNDGHTKLTKSTNTLTSTSIGNRKRRRRNSNSGCGHNIFNKSPFIVKRYQLLRVSTANSPSGSFSQRRIHYIKQLSNHSPLSPRYAKKRRLSTNSPVTMGTAKKRSVHRVWIPPNTLKKSKIISKRVSGLERKTRQGNKQWLSSDLVNKKKSKIENTNSNGRGSSGRGHKLVRRKEVSLKGQYVISKNGKSLKRLPNKTKLQVPNRTSTVKRMLANHAVQRSLNKVWLPKTHTNWSSTSSRYCVFYNRFGRCNRGKDCTFIHDPKRVAVCSKFLRGKCNQLNGSCPFSHVISKEKMPVCSFFLRGVCTREDCPYTHVSVGPGAQLCHEFIRGYCPLGDKCTKQHTLTCPDYASKGTCPRGKYCPLRHWRKKREEEATPKRRPHYNPTTPTLITPHQLDFIPLDTKKMPDFIAL